LRAEPDFTGVVVAAGRSTRCTGGLPKQFQEFGGSSVLEWSVRALADRPAVGGVVVVLAADELRGPRGAAARNWPGVAAVVAGGATRAESVLRGLEAAGALPFVLVHDAARPLVSAALVDAVVEATRRHGAAVPVVEIPDTVKAVALGRILRTIPREELRLAQTPQGARRDWLRAALGAACRAGQEVTDEAAALEHSGHAVAAVPGEGANRKITTAEDLGEARRSLGPRGSALRVGTGFDVHRLDPDRPLVLGGLPFPGEAGLSGHSDADVVLHAAMDALLGAAGLGDIGTHFPPDDERFEGAASTVLAGRVRELVEESGFDVVNLDLTVLAEAPRIAPRSAEMRRTIAECLRIDASRVGVKATTLERLGALGRGEGIACQAVALLVRER